MPFDFSETMPKKKSTSKVPTSASPTIKRPRKWGNQFDKKYTDDEIERIGEEMVEWFNSKKNFWLKDFAVQQMIGNRRLSEFAQKNEYFAYLFGIAKEMQEAKLFKLGRAWKGAMPIFALKNTSGWSDKQDVNLSGSVRVIRDTIK